MAKKAYVRNSENTEWVELASATTDLSNYLTTVNASSTYLSKLSASADYSTKLYTDSAVNLHQSTSTSVHGIADTSQLATKSYADTVALTSASAAASSAVSSLIDSSPSTLDTLNELAAALGDDPNFATTITDLISQKLTSVPGVINQFAGSGSAAPTGWLFCDGQEVLITTYQNLYNALTSNGFTFPYGANTNGSGGAGSTHFRIPNFKGRVPVGKDSSQTEFDLLGESGGSKTVTLTSTQSGVPLHSHANSLTGTTTFAASGHTHGAGNISAAIGATNSNIAAIGYVAGGTTGGPATSTYTITGGIGGSQTFNHYTPTYGNTGGNSSNATVSLSNANNIAANASEAHNNIQPYITINYIIKT
jgi:microcystin-dependent protein